MIRRMKNGDMVQPSNLEKDNYQIKEDGIFISDSQRERYNKIKKATEFNEKVKHNSKKCIYRRPRATCTEKLSQAAGEIEPPRRSREPAGGPHHADGEHHCSESSFKGKALPGAVRSVWRWPDQRLYRAKRWREYSNYP